MSKVCYFCNASMGETGSNHTNEVFHSICDDCSDRLGVEEKLPKILLAIGELRRKNGSKEYHQLVPVAAAL